jgi:hypothetical protein
MWLLSGMQAGASQYAKKDLIKKVHDCFMYPKKHLTYIYGKYIIKPSVRVLIFCYLYGSTFGLEILAD